MLARLWKRGTPRIQRSEAVHECQIAGEHRVLAVGRAEESVRAVAHAVVSLMHGLGYEVVAEGVENMRQIEVLRVIGCDAIQGHAIAKPMDETALRHWARERTVAAD